MPPSNGQSIGRYHILEQLGEGGMATVYKAFDTRLEREVALKIILPTRQQSPKFLKRFEREAKALAQLSHPNIVNIHDYGEHEGLPYLVMEYTPAGTLKDRLGEAMASSEAARLLAPVARALEYAHAQKIIHRDVKPSNILITRSGEPMLSDFGIAKVLEAEETWDLTGTGVGIGTPEYMAPEQGMGKPVDHRADIYALGIVLYEMVTGRKPFHADTPLAVLLKQVNDPLPRPRGILPDLPKSVEQVILKALAKQPEDRFQDIGEFAKALEGFAHEPEVRLGQTIRIPGRPAMPSLGRNAWIALAVIAAIALSVVGLRAAGIIRLPSAQSEPLASATGPGDASATATAAPIAAEVPAEAACSDPLGCVSIAPDEPILLGYMLWLGYPIGDDSVRGVEIAVDDQGQLLGHAVELVGEDSGCAREDGQQAAARIAQNEKVIAVVGSTCSAAARPAALVLDEAGLTMVSPSATGPLLTATDAHVGSFLRVSTNDEIQARLVANFAYRELGARTAATVDDGSSYSRSMQQIFAEAFTDLGGKITSQERVSAGDEDMRPVLGAIASRSPDFIYYHLGPAESEFLTIQAKEIAGLEGSAPAGSDALLTTEFIEATGSAAEGLYIGSPTFDFDNPAYQTFLDKYLLRYWEQPQASYHAYAYDATMMILAAIEQAALQDADGSLLIGRQALREALYSTREFDGLTGTLDCATNGDCGFPRYVINQVQQGEFERVFFDAIPNLGPGQWVENPTNGHLYALTDDDISFVEAEAQAVSWGGHLVTVNDQAEQDWLYEMFGPNPFWIGLND
ncbi:MAG: ABC transporter substrate-binding protein, partial [Anaerolineales bacterium]